MFSTGNPALRESAFQAPQRWAELDAAKKANVMTLQGTINKTSMMLGVCALFAVLTWNYAPQIAAQMGIPVILFFFGSAIIGLVAGLVIGFNPKAAPVMALPYAIVEGVFVGAASLLYAAWVGGMDPANASGTLSKLASAGSSIVLQAGVLTFSITAAMLIAYSTRLIRMSATAVKGIAIATFGAILFVGVWWILSLFVGEIQGPYAITPIGIGIAAIMVVLASINLLADFWIIEESVKTQQPKYMEWYGGFALLVTIVWLYVSLLRLLAMLRAQE